MFFILVQWNFSVNRKDLRASTLVEPTRDNLVLDPLSFTTPLQPTIYEWSLTSNWLGLTGKMEVVARPFFQSLSFAGPPFWPVNVYQSASHITSGMTYFSTFILNKNLLLYQNVNHKLLYQNVRHKLLYQKWNVYLYSRVHQVFITVIFPEIQWGSKYTISPMF